MRQIYEDPVTDGVLLIDASNAFNALNREAALHNVQYTCPGLSTFVKNLYSGQAELFVASSGETILSKEATTQGGPESMGFYAASTMPLANSADSHPCKRIFYADDGSGGADLIKLHEWWQDIQVSGPPLGYFPNAVKTWLIVKPEHRERADQLFQDINVTDGHEFLGSFIGNAEGAAAFVDDKIAEWEEDINALVEIAKIEPQLAYCAYVFGISRRWQFVCRTTPNIYEPMKKLESLIREKLIPAFLGGREVSDDMRKVYDLPSRLGGQGIRNLVEDAAFECENSMLITEQLTDAIFHQHSQLNIDEERQAGAKAEVSSRKSARIKAVQDELKALLSEDKMKLIDLSAEKGASIWLTSLPLKKYGFRINKQQFDDALCMRYNARLKDVPRNCACGKEYSINHCLTCKNGCFINIRHNAVRDTTHELMEEVCKDVQLEPNLLPVTGEDLPVSANKTDGARGDVSALNFWHPLCRAFFYIRVFNPLASTNWSKKIPDMYTFHERLKKGQYNDRILQIEKGSFTPMIFSCSGGTGPEAMKCLKTLALKLSHKRQEPYSQVMSFIRRRIRFDILKTCVISFRGERSAKPEANIRELEFGICPFDIEVN
jgi:hypothetical protein